MTPRGHTARRPGGRARRLGLAGLCAAAALVAWPAITPEPVDATGQDTRQEARSSMGTGQATPGQSGQHPEAVTVTWIRAAEAQNRRRRRRPRRKAPARPGKPAQPDKPAQEKVFDFSGLDISGQLRAPQLLYFLDRAAEELERASLERRSFLPEMVRSVEEESL